MKQSKIFVIHTAVNSKVWIGIRPVFARLRAKFHARPDEFQPKRHHTTPATLTGSVLYIASVRFPAIHRWQNSRYSALSAAVALYSAPLHGTAHITRRPISSQLSLFFSLSLTRSVSRPHPFLLRAFSIDGCTALCARAQYAIKKCILLGVIYVYGEKSAR